MGGTRALAGARPQYFPGGYNMAVNISATRTSTLFNDLDGDGVFDPGDVILTKIRITNAGTDPATGISVTDTLSGVTLVPGSVQVTPIAYDDVYNLTGNTPITIAAGLGLLLNDVDPDGAGGNLGLTVTSVDTTGTHGTVAFNANGSFTFTPETGYTGTTAFKYYVQDAQGLGNVTEGIVTLTITGLVWYVDNTYNGVNGPADGSYMKPFTTLNPLNDNGTGAGGTPGTADGIIGDDDVDGAGSTIFVYHNGADYTAGIALESGQTLLGDGVGYLVNGHNIGGTERTGGIDNVSTNSGISLATGTVVTLSSGNTIKGLTLNTTGGGAIAIDDGGNNVGTLTIDVVSITGSGKAVDIDQGGDLNVDIDQLSSSASSTEGIHLQGVTGTFGAATGTIQTSTGTAVLIGASGGAVAGSGGSVAFTYGGDITNPGGSLVEIQDRVSGTVTFSGNLTEGAAVAGQTAILIDGSGGTVNFNGQTSISTGAGNGVTLTNNSGTINFAPTGTGFDITTTTGKGLTFTGGGTLNITGAANSITTGTGQIMDLQNGAMGTSGIAFQALTSGVVASGNAININNLDAAGAGTFSGGAVIIAGANSASADGINITGSNSTFGFASAQIDNVFGDAIEINGTSPNVTGAVTFTTVDIDGVGGHGISIAGATNAVTISGGSIGTGGAVGPVNDPAGDGVNITGGTGAVTIAAAISKTTAGNVVEVENHETGNVTFSGALSATGGVNNGILVNNSNSGTIAFNGQTLISTGANAGVTLTSNTGGTIAFNAGGNGLDITTGTGAGFTATGGGTVTVQGAGNTITSAGGVALTITNTTIGANDVTFQSISANGGSYGIRLNTTGSAGGLHVTGTGSTDGSGGTIQNIATRGIEALSTAELTLNNMTLTNANTTNGFSTDLNINGSNAAIYMSSVTGAALTNIDISTTADSGIVGITVSNFVMNNSSITQAGNAADESGIEFSNLSGTSSISNTSISFSETNALDIVNTDVNLNFTLNNVVFSDSQRVSSGGAVNLNGQGGFQFRSFSALGGAPVTSIDILDSDFLRLRTQAIQVVGEDDSIVNVDITNNVISSDTGEADTTIGIGSGIDINGNDTSNVTFNIIGNTMQSRGGHTVNISSFLDANVTGRVNGNTITSNGSGAGGSGIRFVAEATSNMIVEARNNSVTAGPANNSPNIEVIARVGSSRLDVTLDNNNLDADPTAVAEINIQSGSSASNELNQIFANIINNDALAGGPTNKLRLRVSDLDGTSDPRIFLQGFVEGGAGVEDDAVATWNANGNTPAVTTTSVNVSLTGGASPPSAGTALVPGNPAPSMVAPDITPVGGVELTSGQGGESAQLANDDDGGDLTSTQGGETGAPANDGGTGGTADPLAGDLVPSDGGTPPTMAVLTQAALDSMVEAAIQRWADAGASAAQIAAMRAVDFNVIDMAGLYVGASTNGVINIDSDAAGYGWFVDSTPGEDSEYEGSGSRLTADVGGVAEGRIDLLTILMHELGHQIGLGDHYDRGGSGDLMYGYANIGERRLPADGDADGAVPGSVASVAFALTPVSVGTLPGLKTVDVFFKATIDNQTDKFITNLSNTATVSGSNFTTANANENNTLDSLTLGSNVYLDADLDGLYDAGEGVVGVALQLYADTNDSGAWDAGDVLLGSTTTIAGGAYSFVGLAPGDYIVVVTAANFANGAVLDDKLIVPGAAADPDDNVDNDNNGVAATGGAVASQTITLAYNTEPTPATGNDTNNTLDFGFVTNQPPVANDDSVTVDEDSGANDLTSQLLSNDTDPENDTRTITAGTNGAHGTVSVVAGVLTYTPNGNYNGTDTFTYTIDDGNGHTDVGTANVTVTAVNDPVTGAVPANASVDEDSVDAAITGMSISDVDAALAPAGVYEATLSATHGVLTLTTTTGLTFTAGDGSIDTTMTFHGTLADINAALATAKYTPDANYNGSAQIDLQVTDEYGAIVATGTGTGTSDSDSIAVTVNSVNDEPEGTDDSAATVEGATYTFLTTDFSDGFSDPIDGDSFAGVKITTLPPGASGVIELNGNPIAAGDVITKAELDNGDLTFVAAAGTGGTSPIFTFQVQDDGGNSNGGVEFDQSANTFTLNIAFANFAPVVDLDADDSSGSTGGDYDTSFTEGGAAVAVTDTDVSITDADAGDNITGATISISNPAAGDSLTVSGVLPGSIIASGSGTDTLTLSGTGTRAEYEQALEMIRYANTGDDPTVGGTNTSRDIGITVTDGVTPSVPRTTTIAITGINDPPAGTDNTLTVAEDGILVLAEANFDFTDPDSADSMSAVIITGVTGGTLYFDSDGAGGADPVAVTTFPTAEYSVADLALNKLTFVPDADVNGAGVGSIDFKVVDDSGAVNDTDTSDNTLTIDVTAVNDSPVIPDSPAINATEQTAIVVNASIAVSDIDLDARNGGQGDYGGTSFGIGQAVPSADDTFSFSSSGASFTVVGNTLRVGGNTIATFGVAGGAMAIAFTSANGTVATTALVNNVLSHIQYTNLSDDPPASVTLTYVFDDGAPSNGGQGALAGPLGNLDDGQVTVNIAAVNDAPVNSLGGTIGTGEDAVDAWLSGMSVSDPDADPATDKIFVNFFVDNGSLEIRTDVVGGITAGDIIAQSSETISVLATQDQINATLAASNGLTYTPDLNFNGNDTLTVTTNDMGFTGADPGLTGDGTSEADVDTRTISVSAVEDPADAVDDSNNVNENATITGASVTGNDSDPDGPALQVEEVNGSSAAVGNEITLASGAKLTLNSNGTYNYNPNGKFNTLTSTSTGEVGAKNTSATDSFTYKLVNGDTATVTITINGVASAQDRLEGDSGDDTITGTPNVDLFYLVQGGNDNVSGLGSADIFFFGATYTNGDTVNGGGGVDILGLQGDYSVNHVLGSLTSVESISLLSGSNANFGDTAGNSYDYFLTTIDANVAAGAIMKVNGGNLLAGEDFIFDGSAESNGSFLVYGGFGQDTLVGGAGNDIFVYAQGRFALTDVINGNNGYDSLFLRGDYTIDFTGSTNLSTIENITLASSADGRYASGGTDFDYNIVWEDNLLANGQTMTINGGGLGLGETMIFNGTDETNGFLKLYAGNGNDVLTGGANADLLFGGGSGDTLTGGGGNDVFSYFFLTDSNSTQRDQIQDFTLGDKIDVSKIDAKSGGSASDAFTFIGNAAFSNVQGELRFESAGGSSWLIQGDVNGDGVSDFELIVVVTDANPITASDFFL